MTLFKGRLMVCWGRQFRLGSAAHSLGRTNAMATLASPRPTWGLRNCQCECANNCVQCWSWRASGALTLNYTCLCSTALLGMCICCVENIAYFCSSVQLNLQCPLKQVDIRAVCRTNTMRNCGSCLVNTVTHILVPLL